MNILQLANSQYPIKNENGKQWLFVGIHHPRWIGPREFVIYLSTMKRYDELAELVKFTIEKQNQETK